MTSILHYYVVNICQPVVFSISKDFTATDDTPQANCTCHWDEFRCNTSLKCIKKHSVCDYEKDCDDNSDELQDCDHNKCNTLQFKCSNNRCIEASHQCDGTDDCKDGVDGGPSSDEIACKGITK